MKNMCMSARIIFLICDIGNVLFSRRNLSRTWDKLLPADKNTPRLSLHVSNLSCCISLTSLLYSIQKTTAKKVAIIKTVAIIGTPDIGPSWGLGNKIVYTTANTRIATSRYTNGLDLHIR